MSENLDDLSGGELRKRFEETLAENRELKGIIGSYAAEKTIRDEGYTLVKPEDLNGVSPDEIATKAKELHEQRYADRRSTVIDVLRNTGVAEGELEAQADAMLQGQQVNATSDTQTSSDTEAWGRVLASAQGGAPVPMTDQRELHGSDAIAFGLAQAEQRRSKK